MRGFNKEMKVHENKNSVKTFYDKEIRVHKYNKMGQDVVIKEISMYARIKENSVKICYVKKISLHGYKKVA